MPDRKTLETTIELYVAPWGQDRARGTLEEPLATLEGARRAVRKAAAKNPRKDVVVHVRGGLYRLEKTVVFALEDSAGKGRTITYAAAEGERPVFTPDVAVTGWRKASGALPGLPRQARGKVYVAAMPKELTRFYTLYDEQGPLPRAAVGPMKRLGAPEGQVMPPDTLRLPKGVVKPWSNLQDVEVRLCLSSPWSANVLPVAAADVEAGTVTVGIPPTYPVNGEDFSRFGPRGSTYVENTFEGMTGPGTWVVDTRERKIYLWPRETTPKGKPPAGVVAPRLTEMIRVEGKVDFDGPRDVPVRGLRFRGLTFLHADRYLWDAGHGGWGMQHDWEIQDRPSAMVRLRGAEDCAVEDCRFADAGATAVRLDLHCMGNRVAGNVIEHVGGCGVVVGGYGPGAKRVSAGNEIVGNHIHHAGMEYWHSPGILLWQTARNRVAHNLVHHMPYSGIVISSRLDIRSRTSGEGYNTVRWREVGVSPHVWRFDRRRWLHTRGNVVEYNEIHHVMERIFDGNAIYCSAAYGRTMIRGNYLHDCPSHHMQAGVRTDQPKDDARFIANVVWRLGGAGIALIPKGHNIVEHNVIAGMHYDKQEHWAYISVFAMKGRHAKIRRNVLLAGAADHNAYLAGGAPDGRPVPTLDQCRIDYNLYWNTADKAWGRRYVNKTSGVEAHGIVADPLFVDAEQGDFRFQPNSPARKLGITPVDLSKVGLRGYRPGK